MSLSGADEIYSNESLPYPVRQRGQADGARQTPFLERFTYFQNTNLRGIILLAVLVKCQCVGQCLEALA